MVVEQGELFQCFLQCRFAGDEQLPQQGLQGSKQAFHASVLPRGAGVDALVANASELQKSGEDPAAEDDFVVRADAPRLAMPADSQAQVAQERPTAFFHQRAQVGDESGAVGDDAQCHVLASAGTINHKVLSPFCGGTRGEYTSIVPPAFVSIAQAAINSGVFV